MVCAIGLWPCHFVLAQASGGGTVVDAGGAAVPNVEVALKTLPGEAVPAGTADADAVGRFRLPGIAPGDYELEVPAKYGFEQYQAPVQVRPGMHDLRIRLTPPVVTQDVKVAPETGQVSMDPAANRDQVSTSAGMLEKVP